MVWANGNRSSETFQVVKVAWLETYKTWSRFSALLLKLGLDSHEFNQQSFQKGVYRRDNGGLNRHTVILAADLGSDISGEVFSCSEGGKPISAFTSLIFFLLNFSINWTIDDRIVMSTATNEWGWPTPDCWRLPSSPESNINLDKHFSPFQQN